MGRPAGGVSAIRFQSQDELAAMDLIIDPGDALLVVTEYGYGKRTYLHEYKRQRRYGAASAHCRRRCTRPGGSSAQPSSDLTTI
jgi:DNA gyrase/topoisomerase IV subunit A